MFERPGWHLKVLNKLQWSQRPWLNNCGSFLIFFFCSVAVIRTQSTDILHVQMIRSMQTQLSAPWLYLNDGDNRGARPGPRFLGSLSINWTALILWLNVQLKERSVQTARQQVPTKEITYEPCKAAKIGRWKMAAFLSIFWQNLGVRVQQPHCLQRDPQAFLLYQYFTLGWLQSLFVVMAFHWTEVFTCCGNCEVKLTY